MEVVAITEVPVLPNSNIFSQGPVATTRNITEDTIKLEIPP